MPSEFATSASYVILGDRHFSWHELAGAARRQAAAPLQPPPSWTSDQRSLDRVAALAVAQHDFGPDKVWPGAIRIADSLSFMRSSCARSRRISAMRSGGRALLGRAVTPFRAGR